ncbi:tetratricopeptide repeat protein [Streptomyces sp. SP17KL33]|uniref:tetratricopeptide repeat protein n=1 Tax=Streptomyces sp. SP17KL33 TaxID=3002534 RepID=UPI002E798EBD|nr:tetratricopeptide repeat protein [Streptomyces sp. SP17KL33]MEE1832669.1 tetratricopeptide repeat protein [Streptomyces sp. SP17KL33]
MRWWKRRSGTDVDAGQNKPETPVAVTNTGDAHAVDGSAAVTGLRSPASEPAAPGRVSDTGHAQATAGSIANSGHLQIDAAFSGNAQTVVQTGAINHLTIGETATSSLPIPHQLPPRVAGFRDRADALSTLNAKLERHRLADEPAVVIVSGMGGVGKTSLAVHWVHTIAEQFPDGQLYVNLRGFSEGTIATASQVLDQFLRALNVPADKIPEDEDSRAALFRSITHGQSLLLLLDNALDARQVRPLIPSANTSLTVITSRNRLGGLAVELGAPRVGLGPFDGHVAIQMLIGDREGLPETDLLLAENIARKCGYLPLTLRIILERLTTRGVGSFGDRAAEIIEELKDARAALGTFSPLDDDSSTELRVVLSWSYADLPHDLARTFRLLGLHPGADFSAADAAALAGDEHAETVRRMHRLVQLNLLEPSGWSRFRFHDLLRAFAAERAQEEEPDAAIESARRRLLMRYLSHIDAADRALAPGRRHVLSTVEADERFTSYEEALAWCDAERLNSMAMARAAAANGEDDLCWRIAMALVTPLALRSYHADRREVCEIGLEAARRVGDSWGEAWSLMSLGGALHELDLNDEAAEKDREAAALWRALGDAEGEGKCLNNLADVLIAQGRLAEAAQVLEDALRIRRSLGKQREIAISLFLLGDLHVAQGDLDAAEQNYRESLELRASADRQSIGFALAGLAEVALLRGDLNSAQSGFGEAANAHRDSGYPYGQAIALRSRARCLRDLGRADDAHATMLSALALLRAVGDPTADEVERELEELRRSPE